MGLLLGRPRQKGETMAVWFYAKKYGWGWSPATIQGWIVLAIYLAAVLIDVGVFVHRLQAGVALRSALIAFLLWIVGLAAALIAVCWMTGEPPRWRWGNN
jgi:hypothetical protein